MQRICDLWSLLLLLCVFSPLLNGVTPNVRRFALESRLHAAEHIAVLYVLASQIVYWSDNSTYFMTNINISDWTMVISTISFAADVQNVNSKIQLHKTHPYNYGKAGIVRNDLWFQSNVKYCNKLQNNLCQN